MSVAPLVPALALTGPAPGDVDQEELESDDSVTTCGRCRVNFVRHPSIGTDDEARWWLCPPCRSRLLGDETRTSARWSS